MQRRKSLIMMTNLFQRMNLKRRRKKWLKKKKKLQRSDQLTNQFYIS